MSTTLSPDADHELQQVERANATTEEFGTASSGGVLSQPVAPSKPGR